MSSTPSDTSKTSSTSSTPYGPAQGLLNDLLTQTGNTGPTPDRTGMVNDAYSKFQSQLGPTASGQYTDPNTNPFFAATTAGIGNDVQKRISDLYAGSGRDPAGAGSFPQTLGRGIAEGTAPVYAGQYNAERQNQLGAIGNLFQGGGATAGLLSGLDQVPLQQTLAKLQGVTGAGSAFGSKQGTETGQTNQGTNWGQLAVGAATAAAIFF